MTSSTLGEASNNGTNFAVSVVPLSRLSFVRNLDPLISLHLAAMGYAPSTFNQRKALWRSNSNQPEFRCFIAVEHPDTEEASPATPGHRVIGVCFSFRGTPQSWWYQQVFHGLVARGLSEIEAHEQLHDYSEISEIHVHPQRQGIGAGKALMEHLLGAITTGQAMLSTPEVPDEANNAWALYRHLGFEDLLRNFQFPADPRPFGILRKQLG